MWPDTLAYLGMVVFLLSYAMDGIIKLRVISIASSGVFLIYGIITVSYPTIVEQLLALLVNGYGLFKMLRLIRQSREAAEGHQTMEWLKPFSTRLSCEAGRTLFHLGDPAEDMYCIMSGTFRLVESGMELRTGAVVGELGFLSPGNKRTQTLHCEEAGVLLRISYDSLKELYFQNPKFGFYFLRLVSERLFQNHAAAVSAASAA
jgi:CRP/FNR family transcriptional regulator, cyclic AMP receptor protein